MIGIRRDPQFGFAMTLATGGMLVELLEDATTVLLPASREDISKALARLKISKLIDGYRGKSGADREAILDGLERLSALALDGRKKIEELEINPLFLLADGIIAVDVLMQIAD
jgi:acyl-CoA synthetase (NDP forming)